MTQAKNFIRTFIWVGLLLGLVIGLIALFSSANGSQTASQPQQMAVPTGEAKATLTPVPTQAEPTLASPCPYKDRACPQDAAPTGEPEFLPTPGPAATAPVATPGEPRPPTPGPGIPTPASDSPYRPISELNLIADGPGVVFDDWSPHSDAILVDVFNGHTVEMKELPPPPGVLRHYKPLFDLQLVSLSPNTQPVTLLTNAEMGQWAPHGQHIVFRRYINARLTELYVMLEGKPDAVVKIADADLSPFGWVDPDVLFFGRDSLLHRLSLTKGPIAPLSSLNMQVGGDAPPNAIAYSPNGSRLAYAHGNQLMVMNADGSQSLIISEAFNLARGWRNITWSPDSQRLAYAESLPNEGYGILKVFDVESGQTQEVVRLEGELLHLSWFPDGEAILFGHQRGSDVAGIFVVTLNDNQLLQLTLGYFPELSPDGRKVAFQRSECDLWVMFLGSQ